MRGHSARGERFDGKPSFGLQGRQTLVAGLIAMFDNPRINAPVYGLPAALPIDLPPVEFG